MARKVKSTGNKKPVVPFVDRNKDFYNDILERLINKIQYALDNNVSLGDCLGYGSGGLSRKGKKSKTTEKVQVNVHPTNFVHNRFYNGSNRNKLSIVVALYNYQTGWFGGFRQWNEAGCSVIAGQKGHKCRFFNDDPLNLKQKEENTTAKSNGEFEPHSEDGRTSTFYVFNLDQVQGNTPEAVALIEKLKTTKKVSKIVHTVFTPAVEAINPECPPLDAFGDEWYNIDCLDNIKMNQLKISVDSGHRLACYDPQNHKVNMPNMCSGFKSSAHFYSTFLHELAHATAPECRRELQIPIFGMLGEVYANEELIAELTAWILSVEMGLWLETDEKATNPSYLNHWLTNLKKSPDFLRTIMLEVNKACATIRKAIGVQLDPETMD